MLPARQNPFAMERIARELPFDPSWCGTSWDDLLVRLDSLQGKGAVVGPHGTGKTTFLDALEPRLRERGLRVHRFLLTDEKTKFSTVDRHTLASCRGPKDGWLIDGAERLGRRDRARIRDWSRGLGVLVMTVHEMTATRLPLLLETSSSPEMLAAFVAKLAPHLTLDSELVDSWFQKSRGNLREALWHGYDHAAGRSSPAP